MINVTQTYLPPFEEYERILRRAWDKRWITNNGELVRELEQELKAFLGVDHLLFCGNGTVVLQMAIRALKLEKEVITTPFSYVATVNSILWERCTPVFADILPDTYCIDPESIRRKIGPDTQAILATHVYGNPCDVEAIDKIAQEYGLKVIYDGAHAFGTTYKGKALLSFGDVSTCSFHATKLFHTVEGGCVIAHDPEVIQRLVHYRSFGHYGDEYYDIGINGKNSEFHAAMGLAMLPYLPGILTRRKELSDRYTAGLEGLPVLTRRKDHEGEYNYSYYPVFFNSEQELLKVRDYLTSQGINTRRYFYPSLNTLPFIEKKDSCPISEDIALRVLCLPLYPDLTFEEQDKVIRATVEGFR